MKKLITALLVLAAVSLPLKAALTPSHFVRVETNHGAFVIALYSDRAPKTVENFLQYVTSGYYNNTIFHRVINGFVIQGGGFTKDFKRKSTRPPVYNEAKNGLSNNRGMVAMARGRDPHSATSQFYINLGDNLSLDHRSDAPAEWGYAVFGKVVSGMDVVDKIAALTTGPGGHFQGDVPITPVIITRMTLTSAPQSTN